MFKLDVLMRQCKIIKKNRVIPVSFTCLLKNITFYILLVLFIVHMRCTKNFANVPLSGIMRCTNHFANVQLVIRVSINHHCGVVLSWCREVMMS